MKEVVLDRWPVRTNSQGVALTTVSPPKADEYVLQVQGRDSQRHVIITREQLYAASESFGEFGGNLSELSIVPDKKHYAPQDHVRLLVTAPRDGTAFFSLEGRQLFDYKIIKLRRGANLLELDLKPEYAPGVYIWIGQVYGMHLHEVQQELAISRTNQELTVKVRPGQPQYRPGQQASCDVHVTDAQGRPAQAELAVGVVDEGIYALAKDNVEDPAKFFYAHSYNDVATNFAPSSYYLGGDDKAPTTIAVRRRFEDTAFWAPQVLTDAQGHAHLDFKLPDNSHFLAHHRPRGFPRHPRRYGTR